MRNVPGQTRAVGQATTTTFYDSDKVSIPLDRPGLDHSRSVLSHKHDLRSPLSCVSDVGNPRERSFSFDRAIYLAKVHSVIEIVLLDLSLGLEIDVMDDE